MSGRLPAAWWPHRAGAERHVEGGLLGTEPPALAAIWRDQPLSPRIAEIAAGSFRRRFPFAIRASGYVVHTLEAALWALHYAHSFREGALLAVNLGEDADTTGAVYGQLAGALFGFLGIPNSWMERLAMRQTILLYAKRLCDRASGGNLG
ncbi:MAG: ADP-ribosylglycohydrolase family protein [Armatimonadota bacterium]